MLAAAVFVSNFLINLRLKQINLPYNEISQYSINDVFGLVKVINTNGLEIKQ